MFLLFFLFLLLWILLSGTVTLKVCLIGAAISALLYFFGRKVLDYQSGKPSLRRLWGILCYLCYLLLEILKAGFAVMKLVYTKGKDTKPELIYFQTGLETDNAKVALANSITLTAGTITVQVEDDRFCIHTLDRPLATGIESSGFERRLKKMER